MLKSRIHGVDRRDPEDVHPGPAREVTVPREVARIGGEILAGGELQRVHEDAHDDDVGLAARRLDEREVAFVQIAHRRDEADALPGGPRPGDRRTHGGQVRHLAHQKLCPGPG